MTLAATGEIETGRSAPARSREALVLGLLLAALPLVLMAGLALGSVRVPFASLVTALTTEPDALGRLVLTVRLPRVLMAALVGAGLGLSGAALQALCRNALADPGLMGVASGAMLGVVGLILLAGWDLAHAGHWLGSALASSLAGPLAGLLASPFAMPLAATVGGVIATLLVYRLGRESDGHVTAARLLLAGIGINALVGSAIGLATYAADDVQLRAMQLWALGSLSGAGWPAVAATAGAIAVAAALLLPRGPALDAFTLGDDEAFALGVDTSRLKRLVVLGSALATGAAIAFTGLVGFVGLVAPHLARMLGGPRHPYVLPGSAALGAVLVVLADIPARMVVSPAELPIGIVTGLVGAPVFIALLMRTTGRS